MSYRSILVCLDGSQHSRERVALAAALARQHDSHLIGLAPAGAADGPRREHAQAWARAFEAQVRKLEVWYFESRVDAGEASDSLLAHGCAADLLVIGASDPDGHASANPWRRLPAVLRGAGRPVLVVPDASSHAFVGGHVLVAWDGSSAANRAVRDALPILQCARRVELLRFDESGPRKTRAALSMADMVPWLLRHGVQAVPVQEAGEGYVGKALLGKAADLGADLIVMGAYGHSWLAEQVFGGTTQAVLEDMNLPVLLSH